MSTNLQDYVELLNADQYVQVDKLRDFARHGIIPPVRGEVWLYLLRVLPADKTNEITHVMNLMSTYQLLSSSMPSSLSAVLLKTALAHHTHRFFNPTYAGLITSITAEQPDNKERLLPGSTTRGAGVAAASQQLRQGISGGKSGNVDEALTLRSQFSRFLPPPPSSAPSRQAFLTMTEEVLGKFWHAERDQGRDGEYRRKSTGLQSSEKDWVWLVTPFVCCLTRPGAVFLGFQKLMERMSTFPPIPSRLASFLTLFRLAIPELFLYFEEEQVRYQDIGLSWVRTLFAKEMWLDNVLRLWDSYLAADDMFELHCYVCVAVLATCKETLEELDGSEAKLMLLDLPPFDVDRLLQDAANLRVQFPLPRPPDYDAP